VLIAAALRAMGRGDEWERLGGTLVAEPDKLLKAGWQPPVETRVGLAALMRRNVTAGENPDRS
jgi:UDP-glucose 4-epimerase